MNRKLLLYIPIILILFSPQRAGATHAAGSELIYEWLRDSTYRFYFKLFRDCSGIAESNSVNMCYFSPCDGRSGQIVMQKMTLLANNQPNGQAVSTGCPFSMTQCDWINATIPGFQEWWYMADLTLPSRCENWTFYLSINARNTSDNLITSSSNTNLYIEATLNNKDFQQFSSPYFSVKPIPYVCVSEPIGYSGGPVDPDGDILTYEFIRPRNQVGGCVGTYTAVPVNFVVPFDLGNPFATTGPFNFDQATSLMNFTPSLISKNGIAVRVNKYRNGIKLGSVMRDIQFQVISCSSAPVNVEVIPTTVSGARYVNGRIEACAGVPFRFCYKATTDLRGSLLVTSDNHDVALPGSSAIYNNQATDSVLACISWSSLDTGLRLLTVTVKDSTCRSPGVIIPKSFVIPIYINPWKASFLETPICLGDTVKLEAQGSSNINWTVLPGGDGIQSLSCTNCKEPIARPITTTTYVASYNTSESCATGDTIVVQVTETAVAITPEEPLVLCEPDSLRVSAIASGPKPTIALDCGINTGSALVTTDSIEVKLLVPGGVQSIYNPASTPFNGNHHTARHQYLIRASDLLYSGVRSGTLTGLSFYLTNPSTAAVFENLKIALKCTNEKLDVNQGFQNGTVGVYDAGGPVTLAGAPGWRHFPFDRPYNWDGKSDILVELCYANSGLVPAVFTQYYTTDYDASMFQYNVVGNICIGDPALTATPIRSDQLPAMRFSWASAPDRDYEYKWTGNDWFSSDTLPEVSTFIEKNTAIVVSVLGRNDCMARDTLFVSVSDHRYIMHPDTVICAGTVLRLYVKDTASDQAGFSARWFEHAFLIPTSLSCDTCYAPLAEPLEDIIYRVVVTDSFGCIDTLSTDVIVDQTSQVKILNRDTTIGYGMPLRLNATGTENYVWSPSRWLDNAWVSDPIARPGESVIFVVMGIDGSCYSYDTVRVKVDYEGNPFIPTAFSPNGDGKNDVFRVGNLTFQKLLEFRVFNRWGEEVFSTTDPKEGWNGQWKGLEQPMGVYHYLIRLSYPKGEERMFKGGVTLVR